MAEEALTEQLDAVVGLIGNVIGDDVLGAYLYGSAVAGGLGPASDLDVFVVTRRPTTAKHRANLIDGLRPISARGLRPPDWRPVELTIVAQSDIEPWLYPPRMDFQSGEWLRADFDSGVVKPWTEVNPDVAVLIAMVSQASEPVIGPPATDLLPEIPAADVRRAMTGGIAALLADMETDTNNVLLTLARIWHTLRTGDFTSKARAAEWAARRLPADHANVLSRSRDVYRGIEADDWSSHQSAAHAAGAELVERIRAAS